MTTTLVTGTTSTRSTSAASWGDLTRESASALAQAALSFVDTASTSLGRATAYNDRATQQIAELGVHDALLRLDRGLYALLLTLPGMTDRARQVGVKNLLGIKSTLSAEGAWLAPDVERRVLSHLVAELPAPRIFKMFAALRVSDEAAGIHRANNARTRKLILRVVLGSPRVELWAVKYRRKMAESLTHAWGRRTASIVRSILEKDACTWTGQEQAIVHKAIDRYAPAANVARVRACVGFALGARIRSDFGLLSAYEAAKTDLAAGAKLPTEVLEGIRSVFHKETKPDEVLRLTASTMTTGKRLTVQRRAAEAGPDVLRSVRMDPTEHDAVRLYLYAFEMGMTDAIASALRDKAKKAASALRLAYRSIGILVDASASMEGSGEQRLRPMATALAIRDVLTHAAPSDGGAAVLTSGGVPDGELLVRPAGATSLADALLELVARGVEAVFVLSDGYENRPAGRFAEVVDALRTLGVATPIYHLNPVFAAESKGVRSLGTGVATLPVSGPTALAVGFVRGMLQSDPHRGLDALVQMTLPALTA